MISPAKLSVSAVVYTVSVIVWRSSNLRFKRPPSRMLLVHTLHLPHQRLKRLPPLQPCRTVRHTTRRTDRRKTHAIRVTSPASTASRRGITPATARKHETTTASSGTPTSTNASAMRTAPIRKRNKSLASHKFCNTRMSARNRRNNQPRTRNVKVRRLPTMCI